MADDNILERRLSTVETNYIRLHEDVNSLSRKMDSLAESIRGDINALVRMSTDRARPQWGVIISGVMMCLTILGISFVPLREAVVINRAAIQENSRELSVRAREMGARDERLKALERSVFGD